MPVERCVCFAEQNALLCGKDVWLCLCGCICVVFDNNNRPALLAFLEELLSLLLLLIKWDWEQS